MTTGPANRRDYWLTAEWRGYAGASASMEAGFRAHHDYYPPPTSLTCDPARRAELCQLCGRGQNRGATSYAILRFYRYIFFFGQKMLYFRVKRAHMRV